MISTRALCLGLATCFSTWGCVVHHEARVQTALLPPPVESPVRHSGRLWVELGDATWEAQCRLPKGQREVCFGGVRKATFGAVSRSLWTTFPDVSLRDGDALAPGDYLLSLDVSLNALPPDADGPGWSAVASGGYRLTRDGEILLEEKLGSRSRAAFAYGSALGVGAGEVVDAFAAHIAQALATLPESRPLQPAPLPAVVAERTLAPNAGSDAPGAREARSAPPASAMAREPAIEAPLPEAPAEAAPEAPPAPASAPLEPPASAGVSLPTTPVAAR